LRLYDFYDSGNGYKVRLLLALLGIAYDYVEMDILAGETRTPEFLEKNPNGRIPVLELDNGTCLAESNAILFYLAEGTPYLPADRLDRARVLQWMFFEQYSHEPYIAVARFWLRHLEMSADQRTMFAEKQERGRAALAVMERHLEGRRFFVGDSCTIADIALYAYTHVAPEGGFDLAEFPRVGVWLERIRSRPGHVPITHIPG
jgi:glutathione S-transferase